MLPLVISVRFDANSAFDDKTYIFTIEAFRWEIRSFRLVYTVTSEQKNFISSFTAGLHTSFSIFCLLNASMRI